MENLIGFHGTSEESGKKIIGTKIFEPSNNGWFGNGSYFYKDDIAMASKWCKKRHENKKTMIIKVEIIPNTQDSILDVRNSEGHSFFHQKRDQLMMLIKNNSLAYNPKKQEFDNLVFNMIHKQYNKEIVIAYSFTYDSKKKEFNSRIPNGTEICVFNNNLISIKEVL